MSDLSNQAQKLLGRFSKTVDVMKSAYSKRNKMMFVWAEDIYAVEAVMSFLETIRDAPAQREPDSQFCICCKIWMSKPCHSKECPLYALSGQKMGWNATEREKEISRLEADIAVKARLLTNQSKEISHLTALVEGAITTFKAIYAKTPHPDIAAMAFNAIQTLSSTQCGDGK